VVIRAGGVRYKIAGSAKCLMQLKKSPIVLAATRALGRRRYKIS
jgi:hypothetical protein